VISKSATGSRPNKSSLADIAEIALRETIGCAQTADFTALKYDGGMAEYIKFQKGALNYRVAENIRWKQLF